VQNSQAVVLIYANACARTRGREARGSLMEGWHWEQAEGCGDSPMGLNRAPHCPSPVTRGFRA